MGKPTLSRIIILEEPEGRVVIDISSDESYMTLALAVVNRRFEAGYYPEPIEPTKPAMSYSQVRNLPKGVFRDFGFTTWQRYREDLAKWEREHVAWLRIQECVKNKDGAAAIQVLTDRKEFNGEGFEIFDVHASY